jgi:hypothetical protein
MNAKTRGIGPVPESFNDDERSFLEQIRSFLRQLESDRRGTARAARWRSRTGPDAAADAE